MKQLLLNTICFLIFTVSVQSQVLYGTTPAGGVGGGGTIDKFIPATNELTVAKSFKVLRQIHTIQILSRLIMESSME